MPPLAGVAAAIATSVTAAGVMSGLMIVGTGLQLAGKITGSKTLGNIGLGMSMAGGIGKLGQSIGGATVAADTASKAAESGISQTLSKNTNKMGLKDPFNNLDKTSDVSDTFKGNMSKIGKDTGLKQEGGSMFSDMKDSLMRYDRTANVLGGVADAYMQTRGIEAQKDMQTERLDQERDFRNEDRANLNAGSQFAVKPGIKYNQNKPLYQAPPLLRTV